MWTWQCELGDRTHPWILALVNLHIDITSPGSSVHSESMQLTCKWFLIIALTVNCSSLAALASSRAWQSLVRIGNGGSDGGLSSNEFFNTAAASTSFFWWMYMRITVAKTYVCGCSTVSGTNRKSCKTKTTNILTLRMQSANILVWKSLHSK